MKDEVTLRILRRGIWPEQSVDIPSTTLKPFGPSVNVGSGPHSSKYSWVPSSENEFLYLENISKCAREEEHVTLAQYTWHTSTTLPLGGTGYWDTLWYDQQREEKH